MGACEKLRRRGAAPTRQREKRLPVVPLLISSVGRLNSAREEAHPSLCVHPLFPGATCWAHAPPLPPACAEPPIHTPIEVCVESVAATSQWLATNKLGAPPAARSFRLAPSRDRDWCIISKPAPNNLQLQTTECGCSFCVGHWAQRPPSPPPPPPAHTSCIYHAPLAISGLPAAYSQEEGGGTSHSSGPANPLGARSAPQPPGQTRASQVHAALPSNAPLYERHRRPVTFLT